MAKTALNEAKNWCFQIVVLQKTLESPLDSKEIKPVNVNRKGNQPWIFTGRTDAEVETPIPWPPDSKNWLIGKDPDAGKDWRQEIPGVTSKFGPGVQNEAGQRLTKFCQENTLVIANILFHQHKRQLYTWTSPDANAEIRLIIFFVVEDGCSQQNKTWSWLWLISSTSYCEI